MSAHTPGLDAGALRLRLRDVGDAHCLYFGNHGRPFATMYHANMPREEASRLMATLAAAPELLAALRSARAWVAQYAELRGHEAASASMLRVIDPAIAKAGAPL